MRHFTALLLSALILLPLCRPYPAFAKKSAGPSEEHPRKKAVNTAPEAASLDTIKWAWPQDEQTTPAKPLTRAAQALVKGNNAFAIDLYNQLSQGEPTNQFFSPYSISVALAMTQAGARGQTAAQMARTLHLPVGNVAPLFAELQGALHAARSGKIELESANALWAQEKYPFSKAYQRRVERHYGAQVRQVDFTDKEKAAQACAQMNAWVAAKTRHMIPQIISSDALSPDTRLILMNAIYFKGEWAKPFEAGETRDEPFTLLSGSTVTVPLMRGERSCFYGEDEQVQVIDLPYHGHALSMLVVLPRRKDGLSSLSLTQAKLNAWRKSLCYQEVKVFLPKFKLDASYDLNTTLKGMGLSDAFSDTAADFSGMQADGRKDLYINQISHKAKVEVDEQGTKAAAVTDNTYLINGISPEPPPPPTFRADHPFLFLIHDRHSGAILFMGRVLDPTRE